MGRSNRQSRQSAQIREWTKDHADSELWDPHQRALAESLGREAYEAIYGRGQEVSRRQHASSLSDQDLLGEIGAQQKYSEQRDYIYTGATLYNPDANNREYRSRIALGSSQGSLQYEGITEWGASGRVGSHSKVVYRGGSIDDAVAAVNKMVASKISKGYVAPPTGEALLDGLLVRRAVEDKLDSF